MTNLDVVTTRHFTSFSDFFFVNFELRCLDQFYDVALTFEDKFNDVPLTLYDQFNDVALTIEDQIYDVPLTYEDLFTIYQITIIHVQHTFIYHIYLYIITNK